MAIDPADFPDDWNIKPIGDVAAVKGGKRLPKGYSLTDKKTAHPYLRVVDFREGGINTSGLMYVPEDVFPSIRRYTISKNDVYISIVGTIGLVGTIPNELDGASLTENAAKICNLSDEIDRTFLSYFLRSSKGQHEIGAQTVGSTQPKLALFRIKDIEIPVPKIEEQRAIANILGTLDDKIELNRRMNATLEAMARAVFKSWFVDFDPVCAKAEGRRPFGMNAATAALFPDSFQNSPLGKIPKGWKAGRIADLASVTSGKRPEERSPEPTAKMKIPLYGGGGLMAYVDELLYSEPIILTGRVGTLGMVFRISYPCWPSDNTLVVVPHSTLYYEYIYFWMRSIDFESLNRGSTQPLVTQSDLEKQDILIPPQELMNHFHNAVVPLFQKVDPNNDQSHTLAAIRDALLPKLLSGEIRVKDAEKFKEEKA